ncbi:MAG: cupin domain-containing protein [Streptosporangiaceae bacterium]|nr:cupin domain-containing protein [Streptosporangiaceae bacterium]
MIGRIDLAESPRSPVARVWLAHDTMAMDPDSDVAPPPQPGVNGMRYGARTSYLYYTSTTQQVFLRVPVDPSTLDPAGDAESIASIDNADDFCLDDNTGFAYLTRHRANTIDRVPLTPRHGSEVRHIADDPFDTVLVGPSNAAWGRGPSDHGRVAYVTTDGGTTALPTRIRSVSADGSVDISHRVAPLMSVAWSASVRISPASLCGREGMGEWRLTWSLSVPACGGCGPGWPLGYPWAGPQSTFLVARWWLGGHSSGWVLSSVGRRPWRAKVRRNCLHLAAAKFIVADSSLQSSAANMCAPDDRPRDGTMPGIITTIDASDTLFVLGETLRPLLTGAMGSSLEIFDTSGPAGAGPPPHCHPWEEVYLVFDGELEVIVDGESHVLSPGGLAHVPAGVTHRYRNLTEAHFLTIVTTGKAAQFFTQVSNEVEMSPPDITGVVRVASSHDIEFPL